MRIDWRRKRGERTRSVLVAACRGYMMAGNFRPTMAECCRAAERSLRSGFQHFPSVETLHYEALHDEGTRRSVLERIGGSEQRLLRAIVTGR